MRHISLYSLVNRRQRRKQALVRSLRRRLTRLVFGCSLFLTLVLFAGLILLGVAYSSLVQDLPSPALLVELLDPSGGLLMQPTRLYDRSGQVLLYSLENPGIPRRYLPIDPQRPDAMSPELIRVAVGTLEPNFWRSPGFRLGKLTNPTPQTIAEHLVDSLLLWDEPPGLRRTLRMRFLAAQVVARYGHVRVLEWYLNSAYFGHLAYGVDSAARLYLDQPASRLDLPGSALLLAAIQAPALNPLDAPAAALERQRQVLAGLLARGVITDEEYRRATETNLRLAQPAGEEVSPAAAFSRIVLDRLAGRFGRERLERGGLRVITTLEYPLQLELTCLVRVQLARLSSPASDPESITLPDGSPCESARLLPTLPPGDESLPDNLMASAVVLDPQNGQVLALLGDTLVEGEQGYLSPRAPGSLLTPFAALAGFAYGYGPASLTWDIPSGLPEELASQANPDGVFHGPARLRMALANDYLAALTQLANQVGAKNVWRLAGALGLAGIAEEEGGALFYEGGAVSPLDLAQAYGVIASMGTRAGQRFSAGGELEPAMVLYVEDQAGRVWLDARQPETQAVVSQQLAYLVHDILSDAVARRVSLGSPSSLEIGRPVGVKIGRVAGDREAWVAGYIPQRVAVFWMGLPAEGGEEAQELPQVKPRMVSGMWHALMQYSGKSLPVAGWPEPPGISRVEVCDPSGQLPTAACPEVVTEIFLTGNEPTGPDQLYRQFEINRETGRLATVFTPQALVEEVTYFVVPAQARAWAQAAGLPVPPEDYDAIQPPEPSPDVRITSPALFAYVRDTVSVRGTASGEGFRFYQLLVGQGLNPQTWLQVGQDGTSPVREGELGKWDTAGQEGLYAVRLLVARENQQLETATIQVTVDNTAPVVRITYPFSGQAFSAAEDQVITFRADIDETIGIRRVVWRVDGRTVGEGSQAPFYFTWRAVSGKHTLSVTAEDLAGNVGESQQLTFEVSR